MHRLRLKSAGGAALLEVVLSLTLLAAGAAVIGGSLSSAARAASSLRRQAHAADMAVTLLSEVQIGLIERATQGPTAYEEPLEEWTWQMVVEPLDTLELQGIDRIEVIIRNEQFRLTYRLTQLMMPPTMAEPAEAEKDWAGDSGGLP